MKRIIAKTTLYILFIMTTLSAHAYGLDAITEVNGNMIVQRAMKYIGVPYRSGRMNPKVGFDCSGFTSYVFKKENISLTHSSRSQFSEGTQITDCKSLQEGDLVFFTGSNKSKGIGHVGIVTAVNSETGAFSFIHASRTGVCISSSSEAYYQKRYIGACRVIAAS